MLAQSQSKCLWRLSIARSCQDHLICKLVLQYINMHVKQRACVRRDAYVEMRAGERRLRIGDGGDTRTGSQLLGSGKAVDVAAPMRSEVVQGLQQAIDESPELWQSNFPLHTVEECSLTVYHRAHLKGIEVLLSESYAATKSRFSHFALVEWEGHPLPEDPTKNSAPESYIIKILYSVKVEQPAECSEAAECSSQHGACMRFAVCHLYKHEEVSNSLGKHYLVTKVRQQKPAYKAYAVNLEVIQGKVLWGEVAHIKIDHSKSGKPLSFYSFPPDAWLFTCYPNVQSYMQADCVNATACLAIEQEDAEFDE